MDSAAGHPSTTHLVRDSEIIRAYRVPGRSRAVENSLVERIDAGILSALMKARILHKSEAGREVRQRAWAHILDRLDSFQPSIAALTTWTFIQTQAVIKEWFREIRRAPTRLLGFDRANAEGNTHIFEIEMHDLLRLLPGPEMDLVKKIVVERVSVRTIAQMTGVSHTHIYQRLNRALAALRFQMVG